MNRFTEVIGHENLKPQIVSIIGKIGAFLFYGPPSIGKRTIALEIGKYNLCKGTKEDGCTCKSCQVFRTGHPDFLQIGNKGKILVEDVDALIEFNSRAPLVSSTKVSVIDRAEGMTVEAAHRLLKVFEEIPNTFFLVTEEPSKILPTIVSRCVKLKFDAILQEDIANILNKKYGFDFVSARVLGWIGCGGSIDIFANAGLYLKYREMACELLGRLKDLLGVLDFIERIAAEELGIFSDMVIMVMTDMLLIKNGINDIINSDKRGDLEKISKSFNDKALLTALSFLTQVKKNTHLNINLQMNLKSTIIKIHPLLTHAI